MNNDPGLSLGNVDAYAWSFNTYNSLFLNNLGPRFDMSKGSDWQEFCKDKIE